MTINCIGTNIPIEASKGGTGQSSYSTGDTLYASAGTTLSKLTFPTSLGSASTNIGIPLRTSSTIPQWQPQSTYVLITDDFVMGAVGDWLSSQLNGASSGFTSLTGHPGIWQFGTGINNNGAMGILRGTTLNTTDGRILHHSLVQIPVLSDGTDTFTVRIGLGTGTSTADNTDGAYFEYTNGVNSGAWQIKTANNSSRTTQNTGSTVDVNWHLYTVDMNAGGSSVAFYIDGTQVTNSPIATNLPASTRTFGPSYKIAKSAGNTSRLLNVDLSILYKELTTPRW